MKSSLPLAALAALVLHGAPAAQNFVDAIQVAGGLNEPVLVTAPANDARLFIVERDGRIKILEDGAVLPTPFLDIDSIVSSSFERGLLGLTFHPDYASNGFFYVSYTSNSDVSTIRRYSVSANPDVANPASGLTILTQPQPAGNHNGGMIDFGPDGYLYIGFGDGGGAGDTPCNAQDPQTFLGKMLRIDVDSGSPYAIPPSNPFVGDPSTLDEIWYIGLRNPWRWSFDRGTGDLYIGDVGQGNREEIDFGPAGVGGLNYGWKIMEGFACFGTSGCTSPAPCMDPSYTDPIIDRTHTNGWFSITGGYVYRGMAIPGLQERYVYGDYIKDVVWSLKYDHPTTTVSSQVQLTADLQGPGIVVGEIAGFGQDAFGELYFCRLGSGANGAVYKIVPEGGLTADCDGDFHEDAIEIAFDPDLDLDQNGQLDACQGFSADTGAVSASAQSAQSWFLHAGPAEGGRPYLVAGSLNGTSPGFNLPAGTVPLNPDFYFNLTITMPNTPPLVGSLGLLDAQGNATGAFDLASVPLPPGLIGQSAYHAYATIASGTASFISNFIEVRFEP